MVANLRKQQEMREALFFADFAEGVTVIEGRKGSGKTLFSVCIAYKLRELFGRPVICDFRPSDLFGPYSFLDEKLFVSELEKISDCAKYTPQNEVDLAVKWSLEKNNVKLQDSTIILDEAYRYFDARTPSDRLVRVFGYFISQSRHYKCAVILLTPRKDMIDKRVRTQIDRFVRVAFNPRTQVIHARVLDYNTGEPKRIRIYGPNYFDLYESWSPISMRKKVLNMLE